MQKNNCATSRRSAAVKKITVTGMLSGLAFVLMMLDFPLLLLFPEFLKIDFSDLPALLAAIFINPVSGILVELIKNLLHLFFTRTGGVGELANFVIGVSFILPASVMFRYLDRKRGEKWSNSIFSFVSAGVFMAVSGAFVNYYIMLPLYAKNMSAESKLNVILYSIIPFNLLKAVMISVVFVFIYKILHNQIKKLLK